MPTLRALAVLLLALPAAASEPYPADLFLDPEHVMIGDEVLQVSAAPVEASAGEQATEVGFVQSDVLPWPGGVVPIVFSHQGGAITADQERQVFAACAQWTRRAKVRCVRRKSEPFFLTVYKGNNCSAFVGYSESSARLMMSLREGGCWHQGVIMHEFGHVLGVRHEQARPDRDKYITVRWDNIKKENSFNYAYKKFPMITHTPYDFGSIMHYGSKGFSINGQDTFVLNKGYEKYRGAVGQRERLSDLDGQNMAAFYGKPVAGMAADEEGAQIEASASEPLAGDPITEAAAADDEPAADEASEARMARELARFAWFLELATDDGYARWRTARGSKLTEGAREWLPASRREALARAYGGSVIFAARRMGKTCPETTDFIVFNAPMFGPLKGDKSGYAFGRWGAELMDGRLAKGDLERARRLAAEHSKAAGLVARGGDGPLCEAARIYAKLSQPYLPKRLAEAADSDEAPAETPKAGAGQADLKEHEEIEKEVAPGIAKERAKRLAEEQAKKKGKR